MLTETDRKGILMPIRIHAESYHLWILPVRRRSTEHTTDNLTLKTFFLIFMLSIAAVANTAAQEVVDTTFRDAVIEIDSVIASKDSVQITDAPASIVKEEREETAPAVNFESSWKPDPKKAMWMAIVIPGGGQIYNRKYWKLPLVYGGFVGCIYAMQWNGQMYSDYSQAYQDIMDDDPETKSYEDFLHLGAAINESNIERYKTLFKNRKDRYRRWRDLSLFCLIGVYGLSIIDAYVDASLSQFDISDDLSMKVAPAYINNNSKNMMASRNAFENSGLGIRCQLNF